MKYDYIVRLLLNTPWALLPSKLDEICYLIDAKMRGVPLGTFEAAIRPQQEQRQGVAVIPVFGTITKRANLMTQHSGGTSTEALGQMIRMAVAEPSIGSIVLDVDSPGGSVYGVSELADEIHTASKRKNIVAVANSQAASAAYWLGSQASEFVVTPSGEVGSIGVMAAHVDESQAMEKEGLKVSLITAGKYKGEGSSTEPLSDDTRAYMQSRVDEYYDSFVKAVARGRKVSVSDVRDGFGQGRMVSAKNAVKASMADRVATLDDVLGELTGEQPKVRIAAEAEPVKIAAEVDAEPDLAAIETEINEKLKKLGYAV